MRLAFLVLPLIPLAGLAAAQALPPPVQAAADAQSAACRAAGGTPTLGPAYATAVDLNGDGEQDYIVDLAGLECANAWSFFCSAAGCPVSVWLSGPDGHAAAWGDDAQGWELAGTGDAMTVVVSKRGAACPGETAAVEGCTERLDFAAGAPPDAEAAEVEAERLPDAGPMVATQGAAPGPDAWSLREAPGGAPVALVGGPGDVRSVAAFCLSEQAWLAVAFDPAPQAETVEIGFAGAVETVTVPARREEGAGGAFVIGLTDQPLAGLLSGRDATVRVTVGGSDAGVLSLRGSTRALRDALAACPPG